ncbi:LysR family transcriptional regulator [Roseovarius sp. M141]|uniref:LysR family transcriptional regulator n=1 Tax=Roseovarius sp. M141 TaxID=2583806 RepID=UPI0026E52DF1|nr:LysR family transcriptional regulator [Roseovarius sp. M141]
MDRPNLPLTALRAFEAAARQGSFTSSAVELCATQAAVSYQVISPEKTLGVSLSLQTDLRWVDPDRRGQRLAAGADEDA